LITCIEVDIDGAVWFGSYEGAVKFDGTNYTRYYSANSGLPGDIVDDIAIDRFGNKWIASGGRLAVFNEGGVVSVDENSTHPIETFSLSQCYPNPFNPSTTIEFSLPHADYVTLKVYNVLGEEVALLIEGDHALGTFKVTWDASGLPSDVYFYRLTAGEHAQTKKMVLLK
jgi:hypothetical protein